MKIYFAGSIRAGRDDQNIYLEIIKLLGQHGQVLTEHIGDPNLTEMGQEHISKDDYIYKRDVAWIGEADFLVAEVTNPSLGVGYEIGYAESQKKTILCLYREQEGKLLSCMINGNPNLNVSSYVTIEEADQIIKDFFKTHYNK